MSHSPDLLRRAVVDDAQLLVVKIGSRCLSTAAGELDADRVEELGREIAEIVATGRQLVLVSSGAVAAGLSRMGLRHRPSDLATLQAVAAVGQCRLMEAYQRSLAPHGLHAAQVLLVAEDLSNRQRYLNARNTLLRLLEAGVVPVINENDTVAVDELQLSFGDNDHLAACVTNLLRAPLLILLTDAAGLFDGPPQDEGTQVVETVLDLDATLSQLQQAGGLPLAGGISRGGMESKLQAANLVVNAGESVMIADGRTPGVLARILSGEKVGTLIAAGRENINARKRWIGLTARPKGTIVVDAGAVRALATQGVSLLPVGVVEVQGTFAKGDVVEIADEQSKPVARGLSNYDAKDLDQIAGHGSDAIAAILGTCPYQEAIHRDNLVLTSR